MSYEPFTFDVTPTLWTLITALHHVHHIRIRMTLTVTLDINKTDVDKLHVLVSTNFGHCLLLVDTIVLVTKQLFPLHAKSQARFGLLHRCWPDLIRQYLQPLHGDFNDIPCHG